MARFLSPLHRGPLPGVWMGSPSAVSETPLGSVHTQGWIVTARRKCLSVAAVKHLFCLRHSWLFCFKVWDGKMRVLLYTSVPWWGGLERVPQGVKNQFPLTMWLSLRKEGLVSALRAHQRERLQSLVLPLLGPGLSSSCLFVVYCSIWWLFRYHYC